MFNQFFFVDISSKDIDRRRFLTHNMSNVITLEILAQPEAPCTKFHSHFRIEIRMSEDFPSSMFKVGRYIENIERNHV